MIVKVLYTEWVRRPSSREYHEAAGIFVEYLRDRSIAFWIKDATCLGEVSVQQSMSRKRNWWDNTVAESFFKTMKAEMVYHHSFATTSLPRHVCHKT